MSCFARMMMRFTIIVVAKDTRQLRNTRELKEQSLVQTGDMV